MSENGPINLIRILAALLVALGDARTLFLVDDDDAPAQRNSSRLYGLSAIGHQAVVVFFVLTGSWLGDSATNEIRRGAFHWRGYVTDRVVRPWVVLAEAAPGLIGPYHWGWGILEPAARVHSPNCRRTGLPPRHGRASVWRSVVCSGECSLPPCISQRTTFLGGTMTSVDTDAHQTRLDSLTGLRFFAAFAVLLRHGVPELFPVPWLLELSLIGPVGVGFFFVLSGFVLTWTWKPGGLKSHFYARRAARIVPLHVLTTLVAAALLIAADTPFWASTIASLFLLQAWLTEPLRLGGNGPSWSLSVEAFFYAVFPFIIRPISQRSVRRCWILIGTAIVFMVLWTGGYAVAAKAGLPFASALSAYTSPVYRLGEFVIGCALAVAMKQGWRLNISVGRASLLALGGYIVLAALNATVSRAGVRLGDTQGLPLSVLDLIYLPCTVLLIAAAAGSDLTGARSLFRGVRVVRLGEWSFALYLVQMMVITQAARLVPHGTATIVGGVVLVAVILVCIALSAALFLWFEKPIERAVRRRLAPRLSVPARHLSRSRS